ncbi:transcriptional regulator [Plantactinospora sp. B6F1]|uniref:transcriptional regulator n=1 Tax=Plantactinospora sp. B6F1 TaxID=3158971 RepID=UPI00102D25C7
MPNRETLETIARSRTVSAELVLTNLAELRAYPYRHLAIAARRGVGQEPVTYAMMAAETLAPYGWELLNVAEFGSSRVVYAFLRRR